ncbi:MAG: hypothetical protein FH756_02035 [Firmicutes bacterium]|nr:hypothetical protein [Bacillota bacterium]
MITKAKDMTEVQITHAFCTWCKYRLLLAGKDYWGCSLDEVKKEELCSYRQAVKEQEETEENSVSQ